VKIAILGGTGEQGPGLALRWAMAREEVIIGSRRQARAEQVAAELNTDVGELLIRGMENPQAAAAADIVVLTVPYTVHLSTLDRVKAQVPGKIFIDVSVPPIPTIRVA
jgi:NADPH-dependent F420 reductase